MKKNKKIFEEYIDKEYNKFSLTLDSKDDVVLVVLRFHLIVENLMERIIKTKLKRGDKIIESGHLSFNQKLQLVDAFDILDNTCIQAIKNLNTVRNKCAHDKDKTITVNDIENIGQSLGHEYIKIKRVSTDSLNLFIKGVFLILFHKIFELVALLEFHDVIGKDGNFKESDIAN
ncbi:MAG: hypothetical protein RDU76_01540 [Candidatus Edwardsbacteria bacterium]|nr:hypothetical protein [Candidatus Edwardsbacteria bacterium]